MLGLPMRALGERSWKTYKEVVRRVRGWFEARLRRRPRRWPSALEVLEVRALMAAEGYDYVLSGSSWANPSRITYSIRRRPMLAAARPAQM